MSIKNMMIIDIYVCIFSIIEYSYVFILFFYKSAEGSILYKRRIFD